MANSTSFRPWMKNQRCYRDDSEELSESQRMRSADRGVFDMVQPKMAGVWHCHVVDGYIDPVFEGVRKTHAGAVTLCQDLTVFNVTPEAVTARQAIVDPVQQAVIGPSNTARTVGTPLPSPTWWDDAAIDWQSKLG